MNSLYERHLYGSCIRGLGKLIKGSPLSIQLHHFFRKKEMKKESSLPPFICLSCSFLPSIFLYFSYYVQKGNNILLFSFALYNNFTIRYQHEFGLKVLSNPKLKVILSLHKYQYLILIRNKKLHYC